MKLFKLIFKFLKAAFVIPEESKIAPTIDFSGMTKMGRSISNDSKPNNMIEYQKG